VCHRRNCTTTRRVRIVKARRIILPPHEAGSVGTLAGELPVELFAGKGAGAPGDSSWVQGFNARSFWEDSFPGERVRVRASVEREVSEGTMSEMSLESRIFADVRPKIRDSRLISLIVPSETSRSPSHAAILPTPAPVPL